MKPQGLKILVVDDESSVRDAIKLLLTHARHEVHTVDTGQAALDQLSQKQFDLVMTDYSMPGMPGTQLVSHIRQLQPAQRVIMVSAYVEEYHINAEPGATVDGMLLKPFSYRDLVDTIERVMTTPARTVTASSTTTAPRQCSI